MSSGSRRRQGSSSRIRPLVPNTNGRLLFLIILTLLVAANALGILGRIRVDQVWRLDVTIVIQSLAILLIILAATSANFFRLHRLNCLLLWCIGFTMVGMETWLLKSPPRLPAGKSLLYTHIANVMASYLQLLVGFLLLIPATFPKSRYFHPFRLAPRRPSRRGPSGAAGTHREVQSIYEDWPDPVPFPVHALYNFATTSESELGFAKGESLVVLDCRGNWWQAKNPTTGSVGFIPSNFVQVLQKAKVVRRHWASSEDEASIQEDQTVEVMEHHDFLSLVRTVEGKIGSVPTACLQLIHDPALDKLKVYHPISKHSDIEDHD